MSRQFIDPDYDGDTYDPKGPAKLEHIEGVSFQLQDLQKSVNRLSRKVDSLLFGLVVLALWLLYRFGR